MVTPSPSPLLAVFHSPTPKAYLVAASSTPSKQAWYPDSGASHHLTFDHSNLRTSSKVEGPEHVRISNGPGISIKHIDNPSLHSSNSNCVFRLNNLMHVPHVT